MIQIRALIFLICFYTVTFVFACLYLPTLFLTRDQARAAYYFWAKVVLTLLKIIVGIDYRYEIISDDGHSTIEKRVEDQTGMIIASKHQSVFETIAYYYIFPKASFVMKEELLYIPIVGWYMKKAGLIPVNRKGGKAALIDMRDKSNLALRENSTIIIYPQGTRVRQIREMDGVKTSYKAGVSALYEIGVNEGKIAGTQFPIYPVAINSGYYWPKYGLNFKAGTVIIRRLPPLPHGLSRKDMMNEIATHIEKESLKLWPDKPAQSS